MTCDRRAMVPAIPRPYKEREDALDLVLVPFFFVQFAHIALQSSPFNKTSPAVALSKDLIVVTFLSATKFLISDATAQAVGLPVILHSQFSVQVRVALPVVLEMALTMVK